MVEEREGRRHELWAHFRFAVVGLLLAAPPARGELHEALVQLSKKEWKHPITGNLARFSVPTIERWFLQARKAKVDPVGRLRRKLRKDSGQHRTLSPKLKEELFAQYAAHKSWSYQLHYDNLRALLESDAAVGRIPSYSVIRRFMKASGLVRRSRRGQKETEGSLRAEARLDSREVRSFEAAFVHGLWHLDFHHGSRKVLVSSGEWMTPLCLGVLDDRSRLACHVQWYLSESAEDLVHGLSQAFQKRGLPRSIMMDNGSGMIAAETVEGLGRLGMIQERTLSYSPYQNGKQENFWGQVEGRLLAMLEGVNDLTLPFLNEATQAWSELEYNRKVHSEIGQTPLERLLIGPDVGRPSPSSADLRIAFMREELRTQRLSDGTISLEGRRFEVPSRYRHLSRTVVRFAQWDLTTVHLVDARTGAVLSRLYPLDKEKNADGRRRTLTPLIGVPAASAVKPAQGIAPLMRKLMQKYAETGLPPAYLPKGEPSRPEAIDTNEPDSSTENQP